MLFQYKALKDGKIVTKKVEAQNAKEVLDFLRDNDYLPIEVKKSSNLLSSGGSFLKGFTDRLSSKDIIDFTRQLAIMLNAGLTITDALKILEKQSKKKPLIGVIQSIDENIRAGNPFSTALKRYPHYFSNLYIALVRAGEASGKLNDIMMKLSDNLEKDREVKGRVKNAMIYPIVIMIAMIIVIFLIITFVVPKLTELYSGFGNLELPASTKALIALSSFTTTFWPVIVGGLVGGIIILKKFLKTRRGKYLLDTFLLRIPVLKNLLKMTALVDNTRTLSLMIESGVPILDSLDIIIQTTDNLVFQKAFENTLNKVEKGMSLGEAFQSEQIFPPIFVQMTIVGENTGHLDETLGRLSRYFEVETQLAIKALTTLIEPLTLIILGLGVGGLVVSIISPIYNLTTAAQ